MLILRAKIDQGFESLARTIYRWRWLTLLVVLAVFAVTVIRIPEMRSDTSNESFFHEDDPTLENYEAFRAQFGREEAILIAITPPEVFNVAFLERLTLFHRALEARVPYLDEVTSLVNVRDTRGEADRLIVEDLLAQMPRTPSEMEQWKRRVTGSPHYRNFLISEDGKITTVVVETLAYSPEEQSGDLLASFSDEDEPASGEPVRKRKHLQPEENLAAVNAVKAIAAEFESPDFPIRIAGEPVVDVFFDATLQSEMGTFSLAAMAAIAVFLLVLFRRVSGVLLPLLVVVMTMFSTIGLMVWADVPFTIVTTILPSFVLAIGVGYSVHLLTIFYRQYQESGSKERALTLALGHSGLPIMMTALTTAAGLFSFAQAQVAPVGYLGIFGGIGALTGLAYTVILMPALLAIVPLRRNSMFAGSKPGKSVDKVLEGIAEFSINHAKAIVAVTVVITAVSVAGLFRLHFAQNFIEWIPESVELRQTIDLLDDRLKGGTGLEIIYDTRRENGLYEPEAMNDIEEIDQFSRQFETKHGTQLVGSSNSVVDILKETHRALNEGRDTHYTIPQDRQAIAQELLLFESSGSDDLEKLVDSQFSKARLTLRVRNDDAARYVGVVAAIDEMARTQVGDKATVLITGTANLIAQMIDALMVSMAHSYLIAGVVITIIMMLLIGSFSIGLLSMVANFLPIVITLGLVMGLITGIAIDAHNLMIGSIALGLAVDDTIHFFHNFRRYFSETGDVREAVRRTLLTTGRAMLFTTLVLVTGFWLFMFATLRLNVNFGLLTGLTLIFALVADFVLAPALLHLVFETRFGRQVAEKWAHA